MTEPYKTFITKASIPPLVFSAIIQECSAPHRSILGALLYNKKNKFIF